MRAGRVAPAKGVQEPAAHFRKGTSGSWVTDLNRIQRFAFNTVAGDLLCELGYAQEDWWAESSWERRVLPLALRSKLSHSRMKRRARTLFGLLADSGSRAASQG